MSVCAVCSDFFFQAEDGIRDAQESRGLGDVYKRQEFSHANLADLPVLLAGAAGLGSACICAVGRTAVCLSLIHI